MPSRPVSSTLGIFQSALSQMIPKVKEIKLATAKAINSIPLVVALRTANRKIKTTIAFSLFRRHRFILAAVARYWLGLSISVLVFLWAWGKFIHDPSSVVRYAKILTLFIPVSYEVMKVASRIEHYHSRRERKKMPEWVQALAYDESLASVPGPHLWQVLPFFGSWAAVLLAIYLAS